MSTLVQTKSSYEKRKVMFLLTAHVNAVTLDHNLEASILFSFLELHGVIYNPQDNAQADDASIQIVAVIQYANYFAPCVFMNPLYDQRIHLLLTTSNGV